MAARAWAMPPLSACCRNSSHYRFVHREDWVPLVPPEILGYVHGGTLQPVRGSGPRRFWDDVASGADRLAAAVQSMTNRFRFQDGRPALQDRWTSPTTRPSTTPRCSGTLCSIHERPDYPGRPERGRPRPREKWARSPVFTNCQKGFRCLPPMPKKSCGSAGFTVGRVCRSAR